MDNLNWWRWTTTGVLVLVLTACGGGGTDNPGGGSAPPRETLTIAPAGAGSGVVESAPAGVDCGATCAASFDQGSSVTLTATAASGSVFTAWSGDCSGAGPTVALAMSASRHCTATFEPLHRLDVTKSGSGNGSIDSSPAGIDCGASCSLTAQAGTVVRLTATAASGSDFIGWTGDCSGAAAVADVALSAPRTCNAQFDVEAPQPTRFALTVTSQGDGSGAVSSAPSGIACGATCTANFNSGTQVTLTAVPASGSGFIGWSGNCGGNTLATTLQLTAAASCGASFGLLPPPPVLQIAYALKRFDFAWAATTRTTHYRLWSQAAAGAAFLQVGGDLGTTATSQDIAVHRIDWPAIAYKLQACNAAGCTDSATVSASSGMLPTIGYVKASNTGTADQFGFGMALSADGNTLAVGAFQEDSGATGINGDEADNSAARAGAVYVYAKVNGNWLRQAYVKGSGAITGDSFGWAVALSADGSTMVVGAVDDDTPTPGLLPSAGAAYVFTRTASTWSEQAVLRGSASGANAGWSVALAADGNTLAVGARGDGGTGSALVYTRSGSTWAPQATLKASNPGASDLFGAAVALSDDGNTLAVGAWQEASNATGIGGDQANNTMAAAGATYVFVRNAGAWSQQAYVKASNTRAGAAFGFAVSLSGDGSTLAVGSPQERSNATGIGGDQSNIGAADAGAAYLFTRSGLVWSQIAYVKASNRSGLFGSSLSLTADGNALAVGGPGEAGGASGINGNQSAVSGGAGAAYFFVRESGIWRQQAYVKAPNTGVNDNFGRVVALSSDGGTLAVTADLEDSAAIGINGDRSSEAAGNSGAAYLY